MELIRAVDPLSGSIERLEEIKRKSYTSNGYIPTIQYLFIKKMAFLSLTPLIRTKDIEATIQFYKDILGFECPNYNENWSWATLSRDGIEMMVAAPNAHLPFEQSEFTGSFYFRVNQVDPLWQELKNKARVCYELEEFDYGMKEFAIYDNNGYLLQFGEETDS